MTAYDHAPCCTACSGSGSAGGDPCADCYTTGHPHPQDDAQMSQPLTACRLGYVEYDGFQYCHEHGGWVHYTARSLFCDRAGSGTP